MKQSRKNFIDFSNRDIWEEGKKSLERRKKRRILVRNFSVLCFIAVTGLIICVFLRPELFSLFSLSKISQHISGFFPDQQENLPIHIRQNTYYPGSNTPAEYTEYRFTKEQVDKAKKQVLQQQKATAPPPAYFKQVIEKNKLGEFIYEVELLSGKRFYSQSANIDKNIISFVDKKGLTIGIDIEEIKAVNLIRIPEKKDK